MDLENLSIDAEEVYRGKNDLIYDIGDESFLILQKNGNRIESRLQTHSKDGKAFEGLADITERLSELYKKDMAISIADFSDYGGYKAEEGLCVIEVMDPNREKVATAATAGILTGLGSTVAYAIPMGILVKDMPWVIAAYFVGIAVTALTAAAIGYKVEAKKKDIRYNMDGLMESQENLARLKRKLKKVDDIEKAKVIHKNIDKEVARLWKYINNLQGTTDGVQVSYDGPAKEVQDFWNYVVKGGDLPKVTKKTPVKKEEGEGEECQEVPLLGDRIIITRKHREDPGVVKIGSILEKRYKIEEYIGSGGFNDVYMALDLKTNDLVAVKFTKEGGEQIFDSIDKLVNLEHPSLTKILNHNSSHKTPYVVTEYVDGCNLREIIEAGKKRGKYLSPAQIEHIMVNLLEALHHADDWNIIHRDVKPDNILIGKDGTVKLTDFGLAKAVRTSKSIVISVDTEKGSGIAGTEEYLAPEVKRGKDATHLSDIWAAGKVFFESATNILDLTGRRLEDIRPDMEKFPHTPEFIYMLDDTPSERGNANYHAYKMREYREHDNPKLELTIRSKAKKKASIQKKKKKENAAAQPKKAVNKAPKSVKSTEALEVVEEDEEDDREAMLA